MKAINKLTTATLAISFLGCLATVQGGDYNSCGRQSCTTYSTHTHPTPISARSCFGALAPHGTWMIHTTHGWVWRPSVAAQHKRWHPRIHGGSWIHTSSGMRWQSRFTWGMIVYSRGRWASIRSVGWVWIPPPAPARVYRPTHHEPRRYKHTPQHPAPRPTQHYSAPRRTTHYSEPRQTQHRSAPKPTAVQIPTRRSQRVNSVAKRKPKTSQPAKKKETKASTSSSRSSRTIRVIRR